MIDRLEMLEATLNLLEEAIVVVDASSSILFWNDTAGALTGHVSEDMLSQPWPGDLYGVRPSDCSYDAQNLKDENGKTGDHSRIVTIRHKLGHSLPILLRTVEIRKSFDKPAGTVHLFSPVEETDALPHGDTGEFRRFEYDQTYMEDRLEAAHHQWVAHKMSYGLLWITVDQAQSLRITHGKDACEEMLQTVERTLSRQMKPAEVVGRWGSNEFLVLTYERTAELLFERAHRLVGLARTADFRWWGDRVAITVSIGARQVGVADTLESLLEDARRAMQASEYAGGNHATEGRAS